MAKSLCLFPESQRASYKDILEKLPERRRAVMSALIAEVDGLTTQEICNRLNWPINRVSGRISELKEAQLIEASGKTRRNDLSGRPVTVWKVTA